jgi:Fe-S-cluster containining protein
VAAISDAYARYDSSSSRWLERFTANGGRVHCARGCAGCCNFPVQVSLAEALLVASALTLEQLEAMRVHAQKVMRNARKATDWNSYFQRHRVEVGFCPLLDLESGACTAYAVRPTRCRDTYSAFDAWFCGAGALESLNRAERREYDLEVQANPVTDGVTHYVAPLEELSAPVWDAAAETMRESWGLEVWGDFWVLTTLSQDEAFMDAVRAGARKQAVKRARALKLWHVEIVRIS